MILTFGKSKHCVVGQNEIPDVSISHLGAHQTIKSYTHMHARTHTTHARMHTTHTRTHAHNTHTHTHTYFINPVLLRRQTTRVDSEASTACRPTVRTRRPSDGTTRRNLPNTTHRRVTGRCSNPGCVILFSPLILIIFSESVHGHTTIQVLQLLVCPLQTFNKLYCSFSVMIACVCLDG